MIGVAVPWYCPDYFRDGEDAIVVDAVLSSRARKAFERVRAHEVYLSPWWTDMRYEKRDDKFLRHEGHDREC